MVQYSLVGPEIYMDKVGSLYKRKGDTYTPLTDKAIEAENRYVQKKMKEVGTHEKK